MRVDGKTVNLSPGRSASVEIKTGTRRVIGYFLSPPIQHASESLHERWVRVPRSARDFPVLLLSSSRC
jgi:hypothetical protein